jgi:hypothetical protein
MNDVNGKDTNTPFFIFCMLEKHSDTSNHSPSSTLEQPVEDEATRLRREQAQAEKQEQLRLKRDQKQQEMQAKRDARRQQMAEKQMERKTSSNGLKLNAVKAAVTEASVAAGPSSSAVSVPAPTTSGPPSSSGSTTLLTSSRSISQLPRESIDENDGWGDDVDLDLSDLQEQAGTVVEDELFKDLEVTYKKPAYVGATAPIQQGGSGSIGISGSTTSMSSSSNSSSITLANSAGSVSNTKTGQSPTSTFYQSKTTTSTTTKTTMTTTTTPFSLKTSSSPSSPSRESSPASTPKCVASPLLKAASPANGVNGHGNGAAGYTKVTSPASATAVAPEILKPVVSSSSLALQVDEGALEEDGWGDDWE